ncbi:MAG: GNAT family N-acetyltransferase [Hyphomonadaceae bacterium]|nr:GNAT family N-acetyltransferase [Hyphomonadaceae bacterium]
MSASAPVLLMRKRLAGLEPPRPLPGGFAFTAFDEARHARPARDLLNAVYADGGGDVLDFETWWPALKADSEFDPALCFIVTETASGTLAGFAQCWSSGFMKDIGVRADLRRLGLGKAVIAQIFAEFAARGLNEVHLKVQSDNPSGAVAFYRALGMEVVEPAA